MDDTHRRYLANQLRAGRVVLFTGAGFSMRAMNRRGETIPSVGALTRSLWELAFPGEPYDDSPIGDVYQAAVLQARSDTEQLLNESLTVDPNSLPNEYRLWLSFPWYRLYTLNFDTLAQAADIAFELPRAVVPVSGLTDPLPDTSEERLLTIHLNGILSDFPGITFSRAQYGERQSAPDLWYENLVRELHSRPALFVGTSLDEPPLWQYIEARGRRRRGRELRPRSYLISPTLARARQLALAQYNVVWIQATQEDFAADVLASLSADAEAGIRTIKRTAGRETAAEALRDLGEIADDSVDDEREFLFGREPRWSDITGGYAVERSFDAELPDKIADQKARLVVITGTAGAGKSTSAMRLALSYSAAGKSTSVVASDTGARLHQIRRAAQVSKPDVLLIDDADRFGAALPGLLRELVDDDEDRLVIAAIRSTRFEQLQLAAAVEQIPNALECTVPHLEDSDIDLLLDALTSANRLGELRGRPRAEQRAQFRHEYNRQLLVAMIEVTSGVRFRQKVESECAQIGGVAGTAYAAIAIVTNFRGALTDQEVLTAVGGDPAEVMAAVDGLVRRHLLLRAPDGRLTLRHRVIAERALEYYQSTGQLADPLGAVIFALAASARPGQLRHTRQGRLLIRLINHALLIQLLRGATDEEPDVAGIRQIYEQIEGVLGNDYHYWLQRGSFETEQGDLNLAKNFLDQAKAIEPDDPFVLNQWAYMTLKRASRHAMEPWAIEDVERAFETLDGQIEARGRADAYPFHVYGSQGLAWVKRSPQTHSEKIRVMEQLRGVVGRGRELHPVRDDLRQLQRDLEREYMLLASDEPESAP